MQSDIKTPRVKTAIILAGGFGKRLQNVIPELPKPMAPILGRPFLEHQMDCWIDQGIERFVLSVGYKREQIIDYLGDNYKGSSITYAIEEQPLGTGGGLIQALNYIDDKETVLAMNGDTFFEVNLEELYSFHLDRKSSLTLALFGATWSGRYMGMELDSMGRILSFNLESGKSPIVCNGGVYLLRPDALGTENFFERPISLEASILPALLASEKPMYGYVSSGRFVDIGVPEDYFRAPNIIGGFVS
jgi:D-glycero-alpha-D-manno-heptose 1-phosphate guanylyltransferase